LTRFFKQQLLPTLPTLLLALTGLAAGITAFTYDVGSFTDMGPGFFPLALGIILVLLCALILWREPEAPETTSSDEKGAVHPFAWRPFAAVSASILAWVLLAETAGFFAAAICQVALSALALPEPRRRSIIILAVLLATGGYLLFVMQLGVPLSAIG